MKRTYHALFVPLQTFAFFIAVCAVTIIPTSAQASTNAFIPPGGTVTSYVATPANQANAQAAQTLTQAVKAGTAPNQAFVAGTSTPSGAAATIDPNSPTAHPTPPSKTSQTQCAWDHMDGCPAVALETVAYFILSVAGFLLGLVGILFNWVVVVTVFQYALYFGNSGGMLIAWGILRDIGNILLLFGFIFMGVLMILDLHSFDTRKAIPRLLIFAVLLNFSLFTSEAIVDVSNVLSAAFYKQAGQTTLNGGGTSGSCTGISGTCVQSSGSTVSNGGTQVGIAGVIVAESGVSSSFSSKKPDDNHNFWGQMLVFFALTIFMLIVMGLLLIATIMFLIRAVVLTFLLVVSPLGFAGFAIPMFQSQAKQWMDQLLTNAFFAPIFLLLMFVGLKVMEAIRSATSMGTASSLADALTNSSNLSDNLGGLLLIFGLTVGFMIAALYYAKGSSAAGATFATGFAERRMRQLATAPVNATGFIARRTVGRGSYAAANSIRSSNFGRTSLGRFAAGIADRGAKATYQPGKGGPKGGYAGIVHKAEDDRVKYANSLEQTADEKKKEALLKQELEAHKKWETGDKKVAENNINTAAKTNAERKTARTTALKAQQSQVARAEQSLTTQEEKVAQLQTSFDDAQARTQAAELAVTQQQQRYAAAQAAGDQNAIAQEQATLSRLQNTHGNLSQQRDGLQGRLTIENDVLNSRTLARDGQRTALANLVAAHGIEAAADEASLKALRDNLRAEIDTRNADKAAIKEAAEKVDSKAAKRAYAEMLERNKGFPGTVDGTANHHAASKILKNLKKSESDKLVDALKGVSDATSKSAGGGDSH